MRKNGLLAGMLTAAMIVMTACGGSSQPAATEAPKTEAAAPAETKAEETEAEPEAAETDITKMTEDEIKEAMQKEPAWGTTFTAEYDGGDCTSGPAMAKALGYYDDWGLDVEIVSGTEIVEAIGTKKAIFGVHHIAHMLVPITNGVDMIFTGTAQTGCKSLYVNAGSGMSSTADLVGKTVGLDGPIGSSAHNMLIRFLIADEVAISDVDVVVVEQSAAVQALQNGDVDAVLLSDRYAKKFIDDGSVECVRSITWDDDFKNDTCCVMAINGSFAEENPVIAQVLTQCTMDAYMYIYNNKEEAAKIMLEEGIVSGSEELTLYMLDQQNWSQGYDATKETLERVAKDYIDNNIITSTDSVDEVVAMAWHPMGEKK